MTRPYYNALDALWMLERHGMTFEKCFDWNTMIKGDPIPSHPYDGNVVSVGFLTHIIQLKAGKDGSPPLHIKHEIKCFPDPAGLALLKWRIGDYVFDKDGVPRIITTAKRWDEDPYARNPNETSLESARISGMPIFLRNNLPFIMPQREE